MSESWLCNRVSRTFNTIIMKAHPFFVRSMKPEALVAVLISFLSSNVPQTDINQSMMLDHTFLTIPFDVRGCIDIDLCSTSARVVKFVTNALNSCIKQRLYPIGWRGIKFRGLILLFALLFVLLKNQNNAFFSLFISLFINFNCILFVIIFRNKISNNLNHVKKDLKFIKISKIFSFKR